MFIRKGEYNSLIADIRQQEDMVDLLRNKICPNMYSHTFEDMHKIDGGNILQMCSKCLLYNIREDDVNA